MGVTMWEMMYKGPLISALHLEAVEESQLRGQLEEQIRDLTATAPLPSLFEDVGANDFLEEFLKIDEKTRCKADQSDSIFLSLQ